MKDRAKDVSPQEAPRHREEKAKSKKIKTAEKSRRDKVAQR